MSKLNPIYAVQKWMDSMAGQTFMQYAYSWGAAVVILGTLFKLLHLAGANLMLCVGMGTEVFVFIVSGFERVTEKLPEAQQAQAPQVVGPVVGGPIAVAQPSAQTSVAPEGQVASAEQPNEDQLKLGARSAETGGGLILIGGGASVSTSQASDLTALAEATDPKEVEEAVKNYAEQLTELTEVLGRVKKQAERMSTDSEEMENLNRTLTGIATVYELQLRNISKQVSTIEQIDEQTRRMASQIEELNNVYGRMIGALTVNMKA